MRLTHLPVNISKCNNKVSEYELFACSLFVLKVKLAENHHKRLPVFFFFGNVILSSMAIIGTSFQVINHSFNTKI